MINLEEIRAVAARVSFANTVVEKDYALGWLLWGIHRHPIAGQDWIFKGEGDWEVSDEDVTRLVAPGPTTYFLDRIRFAAANRLLVRLEYEGSKRDIEPYALARSTDGNLLLRSIRHKDGESRSYRFDRIENVQVLTQTFTPRYVIEITSAGFLPVRQLTRTRSPQKIPSSKRSRRPARR